MPDREKVIKGLELCTSKIETRTQIPCETCPYHNRKYHGVLGDGCCNARSLQRDCLALLKAQEPEALDVSKPDSEIGCWYDITHNYTLEQVVSALKAQEPVEPTIGGDADGPCRTWWYQCGKCKEAIDYHDKYCRNCGRPVKWE